jgi:hypothetical protein
VSVPDWTGEARTSDRPFWRRVLRELMVCRYVNRCKERLSGWQAYRWWCDAEPSERKVVYATAYLATLEREERASGVCAVRPVSVRRYRT